MLFYLPRSTQKRTKVLRGARQRSAITVDLSRSEPRVSIPLGILDGEFMLSADKVDQLKLEHGLTEDQLLNSLITPASKLARPPISSFPVGYAEILNASKWWWGNPKP